MFVHGKTKQVYYSVREKIKHYSKRAYNDKSVTPEQKAYALKRLGELKALDNQPYTEPRFVVTDDKFFGNGISKPRLCVAVLEDSKQRVMLAPVVKRTTKTMILDEDIERQISDRPVKWVDKNDIYERKYVNSKAELTTHDKAKLVFCSESKKNNSDLLSRCC